MEWTNNVLFGRDQDASIDAYSNCCIIMHNRDLKPMTHWFLQEAAVEILKKFFVSVVLGCTQQSEPAMSNLLIGRERGWNIRETNLLSNMV